MAVARASQTSCQGAAVNFHIYVPSRSRAGRSITLEALCGAGLQKHVTLVVPYAQGHSYLPLARQHGIAQVLRCKEDGIANVRRFIGERAPDKFLMLDDDLRFSTRNRKATTLHIATGAEILAMVKRVYGLLHHFAHVAISARQGNNRMELPFEVNSRPLRALAYRKKEFLQCEHGRVRIMEDFDVTLQLLRMGFQNCVVTQYAQDQQQTQLPGGCSDYRTHAVHAQSVKALARLHPDFVKLRTKENKTGGDFGTRLEATIQWEKAWKSSTFNLIGEL
jgi:hypothetical protein